MRNPQIRRPIQRSQTLRQRFRQQWNTLLGLASLCLVLVFTACTQSPEQLNSVSTPSSSSGTGAVPTEIRIGYQVVPNAELLAKSKGFVEAKLPNTKVVWRKFSSGGDVNQAMETGQLDVGLVGSVPVSTGVAKTLPYQVYFIHDIIGDNEALAVSATSDIASLEQLKGKRIGVPFGSTTHFSLLSALELSEIKPQEVDIIDLSPDEILEAWNKQEIDGSFIWHPTLGKISGDGLVLVSAKQLAADGIITADLAVVHNDFVSQYPEAMAQYVSALDEAVQLYRDDPQTAAQAISGDLGLSTDKSLLAMNELVWLSAEEQAGPSYLGTPEQPGALAQVLKDSAEFMVSQGAIPSAPAIATYEQALYRNAIDTANQEVASR